MPDGTDDLALSVMRHQWRLDALDTWRKDIDLWCRGVDRGLADLTTTEKIADAVAEKISEQGTMGLTKTQVRVAYAAVTAALASPVVALVLGLTHK